MAAAVPRTPETASMARYQSMGGVSESWEQRFGQMTYRTRVNVRFRLLRRYGALALRGLSPWTRGVKLVAPPRRCRGGGTVFRLGGRSVTRWGTGAE